MIKKCHNLRILSLLSSHCIEMSECDAKYEFKDNGYFVSGTMDAEFYSSVCFVDDVLSLT